MEHLYLMVDMKIIEHLKDRFSYWMEIRSYGKQKRKEPKTLSRIGFEYKDRKDYWK